MICKNLLETQILMGKLNEHFACEDLDEKLMKSSLKWDVVVIQILRVKEMVLTGA